MARSETGDERTDEVDFNKRVSTARWFVFYYSSPDLSDPKINRWQPFLNLQPIIEYELDDGIQYLMPNIPSPIWVVEIGSSKALLVTSIAQWRDEKGISLGLV